MVVGWKGKRLQEIETCPLVHKIAQLLLLCRNPHLGSNKQYFYKNNVSKDMTSKRLSLLVINLQRIITRICSFPQRYTALYWVPAQCVVIWPKTVLFYLILLMFYLKKKLFATNFDILTCKRKFHLKTLLWVDMSWMYISACIWVIFSSSWVSDRTQLSPERLWLFPSVSSPASSVLSWRKFYSPPVSGQQGKRETNYSLLQLTGEIGILLLIADRLRSKDDERKMEDKSTLPKV